MIDGNRRNVLAGIGVGSVAVALGTFGIVGADQHEIDDESDETSDDNGGEEEIGRVRVAHLSSDAPNVDGDAVLEDVAFGTISDCLELPTGTYRYRSPRPARIPRTGSSTRTSNSRRPSHARLGGSDDAETDDTDAGTSDTDAGTDEMDGNDDGY